MKVGVVQKEMRRQENLRFLGTHLKKGKIDNS